jgi:methionyl-tRNA synthetase
VLYAFKVIADTLEPIMPKLTQELLSYYQYTTSTTLSLHDLQLTKPYKPVLYRLDEHKIKDSLMINEPLVTEQPSEASVSTVVGMKDLITIDDFAKVDLRIGLIKAAEAVENADKLLKLQVDIGMKTIQVFSGIKKYVNPNDLIGKQVVVCINLQPRKMKFGLSEGMILAASDEQGLCLLTPMNPRELGASIS